MSAAQAAKNDRKDRQAVGHAVSLCGGAIRARNEERTVITRQAVAEQRPIGRNARIDPALLSPYIARQIASDDQWLCATSSRFPTNGCGLIPSRSNMSTPAFASWSRTCSRPCTRRRASGLRRSRSASPSASSPWTCRRKRTITSRRFSSIRRSSGRRTRRRNTRKAACRSRNITRRSSGRREVKVKYLDLDGKPHEIEAKGLLATCLQHEIDHINGVLFIDHLSKLKRDRVIKKFTKAAKAARRRRRDWRSASSSWARPTSPCPRSSRLSAAAMRSSPSIPARRGRPGAAWREAERRSRAKPSGSGCRSSRRRR